METTLNTGIVIVAGGSGRRMGSTIPKQFLLLNGLPVLARTINRFAEALPGSPIAVVLPASQIDFWRNLSARFPVARHLLAAGGEERFHSVQAGLRTLLEAGEGVEFVAVHDGVRPLAPTEMILRTLECARTHGAAVPVVEATDSYRRLTPEGSEIVDRRPLRRVQTPQIFRTDWLRKGYEQPYDPAFTDDASVVEQAGMPVTLCEGDPSNLKITTRYDLAAAAALLDAQSDDDAPETPAAHD